MTVTIKHEGFSQSWIQWINGWVKKMFLLVLRCSPTENWFHDVPVILGKACAWENNEQHEQHLYCKVSVRVSLHSHFVCFSTCIPKPPSLKWKDNLSWLQLINAQYYQYHHTHTHPFVLSKPFVVLAPQQPHLPFRSPQLGHIFSTAGNLGIPKVFRISSATALITGGHTALPSWW